MIITLQVQRHDLSRPNLVLLRCVSLGKSRFHMHLKALVIGSGFGGISLALRLQSMGFQTTILEKLDRPGGRACVREAKGFKFDMGPTVITVPHFIEELFAIYSGELHFSSFFSRWDHSYRSGRIS